MRRAPRTEERLRSFSFVMAVIEAPGRTDVQLSFSTLKDYQQQLWAGKIYDVRFDARTTLQRDDRAVLRVALFLTEYGAELEKELADVDGNERTPPSPTKAELKRKLS